MPISRWGMENRGFAQIRHYLGKTQPQLADLLCLSTKAIQSFEQGWRQIPIQAERQLLFLLYLKRSIYEDISKCWEIRKCPREWRDNCSVWEFQAGHICWFINGTFCQGKCQDSWEKKMRICWQCEVLKSMVPAVV
jgi:DNA-binding XRE family transcriptional regulator